MSVVVCVRWKRKEESTQPASLARGRERRRRRRRRQQLDRYNKSIKLFLFLTFLIFPSAPPFSPGQTGNSITGSRSPAPLATILLPTFFGEALASFSLSATTVVAVPGLDPAGIILEFLLNLLPPCPGSGAVMGVTGVTGVPAFTPLTRESHFFVDGVMAMRARDNR